MQEKNFRPQRIAGLILRELAGLLSQNIKDTRLYSITITHVQVSKDLSIAKIYYTASGEKALEKIARVLDQASGFLRSELAKRLQLRRMAELHFHYDQSISHSEHISNLIEQARWQDKRYANIYSKNNEPNS